MMPACLLPPVRPVAALTCAPSARFWRGAPYTPRTWQAAALSLAVDAALDLRHGLIRAIMGAGKSVVIAELCHVLTPLDGGVVVVSAPTRALVAQLAGTIGARIGVEHVGQFYSARKDTAQRVIVACNPSLSTLADRLDVAGRPVVLWIVDEAHGSECDTLHEFAARTTCGRIGLTATPYRADSSAALRLFDLSIYEYGAAEALRDGVVVPWEVRPWMGSDVPIDTACVTMIRSAVAEKLGPGLVDAGGVEIDAKTGRAKLDDDGRPVPIAGMKDAEEFAGRLVSEGVRASWVHSGLDRAEINARIERLRVGDLDVIVHCGMLREGVDLPWLRWLCLRRRVASRVAFAQHVGRALRATAGKARAVVFDPHDLFGLHSLTVEACLGGGVDNRPQAQVVLGLLDEISGCLLGENRKGKGSDFRFSEDDVNGMAKGMTALEAELRRVTVALDACGVLPERDIKAGKWRKDKCTANQLASIMRMAPRLARAKGTPAWVKRLLRYVYANQDRTTKGAASDLISILNDLPRVGWSEAATTMLEE